MPSTGTIDLERFQAKSAMLARSELISVFEAFVLFSIGTGHRAHLPPAGDTRTAAESQLGSPRRYPRSKRAAILPPLPRHHG